MSTSAETLAYDKIDRFLRNNLGDAEYAEYSEALDSLEAESSTSQGAADLSDERIDYIADLVVKGMPDGITGFCKSWGWRQFARAILQDCAGHRAAPDLDQAYCEGRKDEREAWLPVLEALKWYVETDEVSDCDGNEFWLEGKARAIAAIASVEGKS